MKFKHIAGILLLACFSTFAFAGATQSVPVTVTLNSDGSGDARGDMVTARFSRNTTEYIGCGTGAHDQGTAGVYEYGWCQASDSRGNRVYCAVNNKDLLDAMRATSSYAYIRFSWNAKGECDSVGFSTQSFYIPEHT